MGGSSTKMEEKEKEREARMAIPTDHKIMDTILENIGKTPLVRLNKIPKSEGLECEGKLVADKLVSLFYKLII